ncbi:MAG: zinc ABC transporter substrate-binding protein [Thermoplasmata archaeon]|nr:zinc ABC transporter substrate-binding protein [Thermoplasmata archaeon]
MGISTVGNIGKITIVIVIALALLLSYLAINFSIPTQTQNNRLAVMTSFYPLWFFASEIGGDRAEVNMLIPDNAEPHSWEPTPSDIIEVGTSDVFIFNGGGFEPWVEDFLPLLEENVTIVDTSKNIVEISSEFGIEDPHFWLDPLNAKIQVDNILAGFKEEDSANASYYEANANSLKSRLNGLHNEFLSGLSNRTKNAIITTHEGFGYLANRYGFEAYAAVGISAEEMPSAQDLLNLAQKVEEFGLGYVFSEPTYSDAIIETIADETGAEILVLDGVHGRSGIHANMDYFEIMYENLENLRIGLEVQ